MKNVTPNKAWIFKIKLSLHKQQNLDTTRKTATYMMEIINPHIKWTYVQNIKKLFNRTSFLKTWITLYQFVLIFKKRLLITERQKQIMKFPSYRSSVLWNFLHGSSYPWQQKENVHSYYYTGEGHSYSSIKFHSFSRQDNHSRLKSSVRYKKSIYIGNREGSITCVHLDFAVWNFVEHFYRFSNFKLAVKIMAANIHT